MAAQSAELVAGFFYFPFSFLRSNIPVSGIKNKKNLFLMLESTVVLQITSALSSFFGSHLRLPFCFAGSVLRLVVASQH